MSKAERTKSFIIETTAPIFNQKGYAGTSLTDLTDATGLTKGSIYGNFENKDEVALAAYDYNIKKIIWLIAEAMAKKNTAKDKLKAYIDAYTEILSKEVPKGGCPLLNTAVEADDTHARLREKAIISLLTWKNKIELIIKEGIASKEFNAAVHPEKTALSIIALIEGGIMITRLTGKLKYWKEVMSTVEDLIEGLR
jgi:AcrR family transcriptional regulator